MTLRLRLWYRTVRCRLAYLLLPRADRLLVLDGLINAGAWTQGDRIRQAYRLARDMEGK